MTSGRRRLGALGAALLLAVSGCSTTTSGHGSRSGLPSPPNGSAAPSSGAAPGCPAGYVAPDRKRPNVKLDFVVSPDLRTVRGSEHIAFTPDLPITELVFRLTANTPPTVAAGNGIVVESARADHGARAPRYDQNGAAAATQGGLLRIPFAAKIPAGTTVTADLTFRVTLGNESFDRFGRVGSGASRYAWFASAQPLLAWERGYGWHTEPLVKFAAESATSEAMQTELTVTAPSADTVIMSGDPPDPAAGSATRTWHATIDAARDVSVAVGPFAVSDTDVGGVRLRVGAPSADARDNLTPLFRLAITEFAKRFGPYPFPTLSVARVPGEGGGIEYPSSILMLDSSRLVAVHETAHQWFYAMVGDSQAQHAWLDEAFASYAEQLVDNDPPPPGTLNQAGSVDRPTASYGSDETGYYAVTYGKGSAALHAARAAAGPAKFDAAIRCYVNANAWRIAEPSDLAAALRDLPAALEVLRTAHALP